jgi:peptidoglycan-associated lipoprotein
METRNKRPKEKQRASAVGGWGRAVWGAVLLVVGAVLLAGCPKKPEVRSFAPTKPAEVVPPALEPLKDVFFGFNQDELSPEARKTLDANIQWLKANPGVRITVAGYCDDRGTDAYNLALGDRRARAVRAYLVAGGIDPTRISTTSYGKERPFVLGNDEAAWKANRRARIVAAQ